MYDYEYEEPDWTNSLDDEARFSVEPASRSRYRGMFLEAIQEWAPEVLRSLWAQFHSYPPEFRNEGLGETHLETWCASQGLYDSESGAGDWILEAARKTLVYWDSLPDVQNPLAWAPNAAEVDLDEADTYGPPTPRQQEELNLLLRSPLQFVAPIWDPVRETSVTYRERALAEYGEALDCNIKRIVDLMSNSRRSVPPDKRGTRHFRWLVLYQVVEFTYMRIGRHQANETEGGEVDRRSVKEAVESTAKLLFGDRWRRWLRTSRSGRPRATRPRSTHGGEDD